MLAPAKEARAMPWKERDTMSLRLEFVTLAKLPDANMRRLCRRYQVSPTTGYKWLKRFNESGADGLTDLSRQPHRTPRRSPPPLERAVVRLRKAHPAWGGRTIQAYLHQHGWTQPPAPSTVTDILRRKHLLQPASEATQRHWQHFEADAPNELWQMDFKGPISMVLGQCHPFTVLDDHSRFSVALHACSDQKTHTVRSSLTQAFRRYGLPQCILMDNGALLGVPAPNIATPLSLRG
jgi:transposase InsO family protein